MSAIRVILVEDDEDDKNLFDTFFSSRTDIELLPTAGNGLELIAYLEAVGVDEDLPQLIILDQNMPKMNGKKTLEFLKASGRYARIPVVVYSTFADTSLIIECRKLGAKMVAVKPIDNEGYQRMMDDFLSASR